MHKAERDEKLIDVLDIRSTQGEFAVTLGEEIDVEEFEDRTSAIAALLTKHGVTNQALLDALAAYVDSECRKQYQSMEDEYAWERE